MSRFANSNEADLSLGICSSFLNKSLSNLHDGDNQHRNMILLMADRCRPDSELEKTMMALLPGEEGDPEYEEGKAKVLAFMEEQRQKLFQEALKNAELYLDAEGYANAVKELKKHIEEEKNKEKQQEDNENDEENESNNFGETLRQLLEVQSQKQHNLKQHKTYADLCERLGVENDADNDKDDNDDDDVVMDTTQTRTTTNTRCPVTMTLMEHPVKNKDCGHSYSRQGIEAMIQNQGGRAKCPMAGCGGHVTLNLLVEDELTAAAVRREKKRQEATQQQQHKQEMSQLVGDDDE